MANQTELNDDEQKALIGLLYNQLSFGTSMEVFNELTKEGIERLDLLRSIFGKLLEKFSLKDKLEEDVYLILGMTQFISRNNLEKWSQDEKNKHLQNRAKYFQKKQYGK